MSSSIEIAALPECPHCGTKKVAFYYQSSFNNQNPMYITSFWRCGNCGRGVCIESLGINFHSQNPIVNLMNMYPNSATFDAPEHTPENIAGDYKTAKKNLLGNEYKAASIMARTALEAAVKEFDARGVNLKQKIDNLAEQHVITQSLAEWAHEIRDIGNDAAHESSPISQADAEQAVYFAEMLFTYLFTLPGMIEERRKGSQESP